MAGYTAEDRGQKFSDVTSVAWGVAGELHDHCWYSVLSLTNHNYFRFAD